MSAKVYHVVVGKRVPGCSVSFGSSIIPVLVRFLVVPSRFVSFLSGSCLFGEIPKSASRFTHTVFIFGMFGLLSMCACGIRYALRCTVHGFCFESVRERCLATLHL